MWRCSFFLTTRRQLAYFIDCLILFTATALVHKIASKILIAGGSPLNKSNDLSAHLPALLFCSIAFYLRDGFEDSLSVSTCSILSSSTTKRAGQSAGNNHYFRHWPFVLNWIMGISQLFAKSRLVSCRLARTGFLHVSLSLRICHPSRWHGNWF